MNVLTDCISVHDNRIYYFTYGFNSLNYYDMTNKTDHFIGIVPKIFFDRTILYNRLYFYEDKIILTPFFADKICIYDLSKNEFSFNSQVIHCSNSIMKDGSIYFGFWDEKNSGFAKYEITTNKLTILDRYTSKEINKKKDIADISELDNIICFSYMNERGFYLYDINTEKIYYQNQEETNENNYSVMLYSSGYLVTEANHKKLTLLNNDKKIEKVFDIDNKDGIVGQRFNRQIFYDGRVYINYLLESENYTFDFKTSTFRKENRFGGPGLMFISDYDLGFLSFEPSNRITFLNSEGMNIMRENRPSEGMKRALFEECKTVTEHSLINLDDFVDYIVR